MSEPSERQRPVWRWLAIAVIALLVLIGAAWATLAVVFPPDRVRARVERELSSALKRDVRFESAAVKLWPPVRVSVRAPALAEVGGFERGTVLSMHELDLDLDVFALLARRLVLRRVVLDRPTLHLVLHPNGTTNLGAAEPGPAAAAPGELPLEIAVSDLELRGGQVLVDDLKAPRRIAFGLASRLAFSAAGGGTRIGVGGTSRVSGLAYGPPSAARLADLHQGLAGLDWNFEHRAVFDATQKRLALERLALQVGRTELALQGVVDDPGPLARLDLRARGEGVDLAQVLGFLAAADAQALHGVTGAGRLGFDLAVRGALGSTRPPDLSGLVTVADGAFRYPEAPVGVEGLSFTARLAPDSLRIGDLRARVSGQPVTATLAVARFRDPLVAFAVQGDVDLAAVSPALAPKGSALSGRAVLDLKGRGRAKDPGAMALEGRARLAGVGLRSPELPKPVEDVSGDIEFSTTRATVKNFHARAGQSSFTLDATVSRPLALLAKPDSVPPAETDFTLRSPHLDLAELLPVTPGSPFLPNARGTGRVAIDRLINGKLDVDSVTARVALRPGALDVQDFSFRGYGGNVTGQARFDLARTDRPSFDVRAKVNEVRANDLLSSWTGAKDWLRGSLSLSDFHFAGEGVEPDQLKRTLTAAGVAAIANGTLGPGPALEEIAKLTGIPAFKELRIRDGLLPFAVERGRVTFREIRLDGPTGDWRAVGSIGFDGTLDYAVSTTVPPAIVEQLGAAGALAAGALRDERGGLLLDLRVSGPAKAPRVTWDRDAMLGRVAGRASQALQAQRAKLEQQARDALGARGGAAQDSAAAALDRERRALADSLRRKAADVLRGFFGSSRDTTQR